MLMDQIRNAKSVAGVKRVIAPLLKRRPLNRGMERVVNERIAELTAAGKLTNSRRAKTLQPEDVEIAVA